MWKNMVVEKAEEYEVEEMEKLVEIWRQGREGDVEKMGREGWEGRRRTVREENGNERD